MTFCFSDLGVRTQESLIHKQDDGTIIVPVHHYQDVTVHMKAEALLVEAFDAEHIVLALHEAMHWPPLPNGAAAMLWYKLFPTLLIELRALWVHSLFLLPSFLFTCMDKVLVVSHSFDEHLYIDRRYGILRANLVYKTYPTALLCAVSH